MRIDILLFRLRFARSRAAAQRWIGEGHIRRNAQRVTRNDQPIAPGEVLTLPIGDTVRLIRIENLPDRRGPAAEARRCYADLHRSDQSALDQRRSIAIAGDEASRPGAFAEGQDPP